MTPREIIAEAWAITTREKPLRKWGYTSSFFETLFAVKLVVYQVWFLIAYLQGNPAGFFDDVIWLYANVNHTLFYVIIGAFLILLLIEWIFPTLAKGAIIGLAAKSHMKEPLKGGHVLALYNFFPLLGIHELFVLASLTNVLTISSLILRYISGSLKFWMVGCVMFFWVVSNILRFLANFAEPAVVISRMNVFAAIGQSFKLVISYLGHVMFLWLLLFVISIRIMINTALALLIPAIAIGIGILLTHLLSPAVSYTIASAIGIILVLIASYFFAYLHVFQDTVWALTYLALRKRKELDVIG